MNPIFSNPFLKLNHEWFGGEESSPFIIKKLTLDKVYCKQGDEVFSYSQEYFLSNFEPRKIKADSFSENISEFISVSQGTVERLLNEGYNGYEIFWALQGIINESMCVHSLEEKIIPGELWDSLEEDISIIVEEVTLEKVKVITSKGLDYLMSHQELLTTFVKRD